MTFDEIRIQSVRLAQNLQARGYKPSQVFGIIAKNYHNIGPGLQVTSSLKIDLQNSYISISIYISSGICIDCNRLSSQHS